MKSKDYKLGRFQERAKISEMMHEFIEHHKKLYKSIEHLDCADELSYCSGIINAALKLLDKLED